MTDSDHGDEDVLQFGPRRRLWTLPVLIIVALGLAVAAVVAVARHATRHTAGHPAPVTPSATARSLARGALVVADEVGVGTTSYVTVDAGSTTFGLSVVNQSPVPLAPAYPIAVTVHGQPLSTVEFAGLYGPTGPEPAELTGRSPRLATLEPGEVVTLVVKLAVSCRSLPSASPVVQVAVKGMRGTADFDLAALAGGWTGVREELCTTRHG